MWPLLIGWSKIAICVLYKAKASFFWPPLHCEKYLAKESAERKWIFQGVCVGGNGDLRPTSSGHDQIYRPFQCVEKLVFSICFYQWFPQFSSETSSWPWSIGHCGEGGRIGLWRVRSALLIQDWLTVFGIIALLSFLFDQETVEWRKWKPQILPL